MQDPRFYSLVLHRLPHVGAVTYNRLVSLFGSPEAALNQPDKQLESLLELETLSVIQDFQSNLQMSPIGQKALVDLEWIDAQPNVHLLSVADTSYPELLQTIPNLPPLLFVRGDIHLLSLTKIWQLTASRLPAVWPWGWMPQPTKVHWQRRVKPSPLWGLAWI